MRSLEDRYLKRIRRFFPASRVHIPESRKADPHQLVAQMEKEAGLLEKKINPRGYLICLDEAGEQLTSRELATRLGSLMEQGSSEIVFISGGPWGVAEKIRQRSKLLLSLSQMTLPHELARVVLLEQVYRAATIRQGLPYHR